MAEDRDGIRQNVERALRMIDFGVGYCWELPAKLVVFPEYFMQGVTTPGKGEHGIDSFMKKAITFDGPEFARCPTRRASTGSTSPAAASSRRFREFPDRWFNSAFIIGPDGELALRYHKWHIPASIGLGTSPHDMLEEYKAVFGADIKNLFPVIDTEIGKLGTMTCHDGCTPEVSRALGYNGVEVICHPVALQEIEGVSAALGFLDVHAPHARARQHGVSARLELGYRRLRVLSERVLPGWLFRDRLHGHGHASCPISAGAGAGGDHRHRGVARAPLTLQPQHLGRHAHRGIPADLREADLPAEPVPGRGRPPRTLADKMGPLKQVFENLYGRGQFMPPAGQDRRRHGQPAREAGRSAQQRGTLRKDG